MIELDTRLVAFVIWGMGTVAVYAIVVRQRARSYAIHRDSRARRDLLAGVALFTVSVASGLSVTLALFAPAGTGIRGLLTAAALGAFTAAGVVIATEKPERE